MLLVVAGVGAVVDRVARAETCIQSVRSRYKGDGVCGAAVMVGPSWMRLVRATADRVSFGPNESETGHTSRLSVWERCKMTPPCRSTLQLQQRKTHFFRASHNQQNSTLLA